MSCTHLTHRIYLTRMTGELTEIKDIADPSDIAISRSIHLINNDTGEENTYPYTGNEFSILKAPGHYTLTNSKVCEDGSAAGYPVDLHLTKFDAPANVVATPSQKNIFMLVPLPSGMSIVAWVRKVGTAYWTMVTKYPYIKSSTFSIPNLVPNTGYEVKVAYILNDGVTMSGSTTVSVTTQDAVLVSFRIVGDDVLFAASVYASSPVIKVNGSVRKYIQVMVGANKVSLGKINTGDVVTLENYFGHTYTATK